jgi:hypothetical protein
MTYRERARNLRPLAALALVALIGAGCSNTSNTDSGSSGTDNHEQAVKFAECMRDNGIRDFPDPDASGQFTIDEVLNGSSLDSSTPAWQSAITACKDLEPSGFTGDTRSAQQQEAALEFAQCIRDNGVRDFPDPGPNDALVDTNRIPSLATSDDLSILNAAMQKCGDFAAAAGVSGP